MRLSFKFGAIPSFEGAELYSNSSCYTQETEKALFSRDSDTGPHEDVVCGTSSGAEDFYPRPFVLYSTTCPRKEERTASNTWDSRPANKPKIFGAVKSEIVRIGCRNNHQSEVLDKCDTQEASKGTIQGAEEAMAYASDGGVNVVARSRELVDEGFDVSGDVRYHFPFPSFDNNSNSRHFVSEGTFHTLCLPRDQRASNGEIRPYMIEESGTLEAGWLRACGRCFGQTI